MNAQAQKASKRILCFSVRLLLLILSNFEIVLCALDVDSGTFASGNIYGLVCVLTCISLDEGGEECLKYVPMAAIIHFVLQFIL